MAEAGDIPGKQNLNESSVRSGCPLGGLYFLALLSIASNS